MTSCDYGKLSCLNSVCKPRLAGRVPEKTGSVKECLQFPRGAVDFDINRRLTPRHGPYMTRCGNSSLISVPAGQLISPNLKTQFQQHLFEKNELRYASKMHPLGKTRKSITFKGSNNVPHNNKLYGIPTIFDDPAGELINPRKPEEQILKETAQGHENYIVSHNDYNPGEMVDRKYDWKGRNPKTIMFGKETPHYNNGKNMAKCLKYRSNNSLIVSKQCDEYRAKYQHVLSKAVDPIADSRKIGPDHTFGAVEPPAECGAGDLIHMRSPENFLSGKDMKRRWLTYLREQLKQANFHNFSDLKSAFKHYDPQNTGYIDAENLRRICWTLNLPVDNKILSNLIQYCAGVNKKDFCAKHCKINYVQFVNFLNWENKNFSLLPSFPSPHQKVKPMEKVEHIIKQLDPAMTGHSKTSSLIGERVNDAVEFQKKRTAGIPSYRYDIPAPRLRRFNDRVNYGDQSDVLGLVSPSLYSTYGVYDCDLFELRSPEEIRFIFKGAGVKMSNELFDKLWNEAVEWSAAKLTRHKPDKVSVEAFKAVLDNAQGAAIMKGEAMANGQWQGYQNAYQDNDPETQAKTDLSNICHCIQNC